MKLSGEKIAELIGLPESNSGVLDLLEVLGSERPSYDEDGMCTIELSDDIGLDLGFDNKNYLSDENLDELYLNDIEFYSNCKFFPFGIKKSDGLLAVEEKLSKRANYIDIEDPSVYMWIYQDLWWLTVQFFDESCLGVDSIYVRPYENPEENLSEIAKPTKR